MFKHATVQPFKYVDLAYCISTINSKIDLVLEIFVAFTSQTSQPILNFTVSMKCSITILN